MYKLCREKSERAKYAGVRGNLSVTTDVNAKV